MTIPAASVKIPATVRALARGVSLHPVWQNELGGLTFRTGDGRYIKYGPRNDETSMTAEAERLRWAGAYTAVPRVLDHGADATHEWLATRAIQAENAVAPRWLGDAESAVRAVGEGLRALHDALPVASCPFRWDVAGRIANAAARGIRVPVDLVVPPPIDRLVVCHGDACCPNTLIGEDGRWVAHVDFGSLGIADRWADIAVAAMSTEWNYGPGWRGAFLEAYGIEPDARKLTYYRDLWNAC